MQPSKDTDVFSPKRRAMLEDFVNVATTGDVHEIKQVWSSYFDDLADARGLFVVNHSDYEKSSLPGNRDFGGQGFLRCWMASNRLLLIQNHTATRAFRYSAPIYCDTNFVSYCEAFHAGRNLGANADAFRETVTYLLPLAEGMNAFPYLMENTENPDREKVRASLRAFAAFKLTPPDSFARSGRFDAAGAKLDPGQVADGCLAVMDGADSKMVYARIKQHFLWSRIVLIKAVLVVFEGRVITIEARYHALLKFLHEECAQMPQFEMFVAYRFFLLSSREPFFSPVQQTARDLDRTLRSMAWDLAHWRSLFDILTLQSAISDQTPFPVPHFLSFDRRFVKLTETAHLNGLIYAGNGRRCEHIHSEAMVRPVSELLKGSCQEFYGDDAKLDRKRRALNGEKLSEWLAQTEKRLAEELRNLLHRKIENCRKSGSKSPGE